MIAYEERAYCPSKEFVLCGEQSAEKAPFWEETKNLLSNRIECMFYPKGKQLYSNPSSIVDALMGAKGNFGFYIALALCEMLPVCEGKTSKRLIFCEDIKELSEFPWNLKKTQYGWKPVGKHEDEDSRMKVFEDDRYIIGIENTEKAIYVYIFKK